jgi:hypothetical protein
VLSTNIKTGCVSQTLLVNILLLRSVIHISYLRGNYMFQPFFFQAIIRLIVYPIRGNCTICNIKYLVSHEISFSSIKYLIRLNIKNCEF